MIKILFVCSGNTCRSVMAEKICNNYAKKHKLKVKAESAGIYANKGEKASAETINALKNIKIRNIKHSSTQFCLDNLFNYDYCIAVTQDIKNYIGKFNNVFCFQDFISEATDIIDPYGKIQQEYDKTCNQTQQYIIKLLKIIGDNQ